ncbi:hypothetical protein QAD02_016985 [Eretmocerus hayati]|uniref:Uncharacterized protein n=1 Tax=Eretmocerus hayati TaxID=131215 RepID=A0ACC2PDN6_9HYME|nr:hypothetical protein QAD02_016985 [Eretmocerus hayati]
MVMLVDEPDVATLSPYLTRYRTILSRKPQTKPAESSPSTSKRPRIVDLSAEEIKANLAEPDSSDSEALPTGDKREINDIGHAKDDTTPTEVPQYSVCGRRTLVTALLHDYESTGGVNWATFNVLDGRSIRSMQLQASAIARHSPDALVAELKIQLDEAELFVDIFQDKYLNTE